MINGNFQTRMPEPDMVPRALVRAMFFVMASSLALVAFARITHRPVIAELPDSPIATSVTLDMVGSRDGKVTLYDSAGNAVVRSGDDKMGFVGVIWTVISRQRHVMGIPDTGPITVARRQNGHIAIIDPSTGWSTDLIGYGADNVAAFARLVD